MIHGFTMIRISYHITDVDIILYFYKAEKSIIIVNSICGGWVAVVDHHVNPYTSLDLYKGPEITQYSTNTCLETRHSSGAGVNYIKQNMLK
jgi:hypothetical protein